MSDDLDVGWCACVIVLLVYFVTLQNRQRTARGQPGIRENPTRREAANENVAIGWFETVVHLADHPVFGASRPAQVRFAPQYGHKVIGRRIGSIGIVLCLIILVTNDYPVSGPG